MSSRLSFSESSSLAHGTLTSSFARYWAMFQRELLELARSFRLLWVPLVFLLLGIMQPVSTYYMPAILEVAGSLPKGTVIEIPAPAAAEVMAQTLKQFGTLGVLILVLVCMGTVSGERLSGTATLILVKPISCLAYICSKWTALLVLTWASLAAGYLAAWYYTVLLFDRVPFAHMLSSMLVYGLWLSFVATITILFSSLLKSPAAAAFASLVCTVMLSLLAGLFPVLAGWTPGGLGALANEAVITGIVASEAFGRGVVITIILILAAIRGAASVLRRSITME